MTGSGTIVRRLVNRHERLRTIVQSRRGQMIVRTQRAARSLEPGATFAMRELTGHAGISHYRLRDNRSSLHLRHRTRDVDIFNEIFGGTDGRESYEAPHAIASRLTSDRIDILDVGGNIGLFGLYAFDRWNVGSVTSYEPDPENAAILRTTIAANRLPWRMEEAAVSNRNGTLRFMPGLFSEARAAEEGEHAIEVGMVDFFEIATGVTLVKIDIEGGEWAILTDPRLRGLDVHVVVMEWHRRGCPFDDPRQAAIGALDAAGYGLVSDVPSPGFASGLVWAQRRA